MLATLPGAKMPASPKCSEKWVSISSDRRANGDHSSLHFQPATQPTISSERLKPFLHFAHKLEELRGVRYFGMPAHVALNEVVGFLNPRAGDVVSAGVAISSHEPQVIRHGRRRGHVVRYDNDGVQFIQAGNLVDQFADFCFHHYIEAGERLIHQQKVFAAQKLLRDGDALPLATGNLRGIELRLVQHVQPLEVLQHFFVRGFMTLFHLIRGEQQVAENRAVFEQRIILRDHTDHPSLDGGQRGIDQNLSGRGVIQAGDDSKELRLADAGRSQKTNDLALGAALANDVANFRVHIAKDDLVFVRKADVVNLKKRFAVGAALGHGWSSQVQKPLSFFKLQVRVGEQKFLRQPQRVILKQANQQNCDLNRKHGLEPEVLVLIQQQGTDPPP